MWIPLKLKTDPKSEFFRGEEKEIAAYNDSPANESSTELKVETREQTKYIFTKCLKRIGPFFSIFA
jgi:predicted HicB family RNase H-like nuclease